MTVKLYKYAAENIRANKGPLLTNETSFNADLGFEGNQNVETPSIIIQSAAEPAFNYAYIDGFKRYYYITAKTWLSKDLWRLTLAVDPVYTFYAEMMRQTGVVLFSGRGNGKKLDNRIIYNLPPVITALNNQSGIGYEKGYFVLGCRFVPPKMKTNASNQMSYLVFSADQYEYFMIRFLALSDEARVALSKAFVSCAIVFWFDGSEVKTDYWTGQTLIGYQSYAYFQTPETYGWDPDDPYMIAMDPLGTSADEWYQIDDDTPLKRKYVYFKDSIKNYADRKAERVIDLPYIGKINLDLDNLGVSLDAENIYIGVEIGYDFGGNNYVVTPFYQIMERPTDPFSPSHCVFRRDAYTTFPNGYYTTFITDSSFQNIDATNTRNAIGIFTGLYNMGVNAGMTNGASLIKDIPNAIGSYSDRLLNLDYLRYQQGASLNASGSGNGGSIYNAFIGKSGTTVTKPETKMFKKTNASTINAATFQASFGKPDGDYRQLSSLEGTGYTQIGVIVLNGFEAATNNEKNMIRDALLSGVIL